MSFQLNQEQKELLGEFLEGYRKNATLGNNWENTIFNYIERQVNAHVKEVAEKIIGEDELPKYQDKESNQPNICWLCYEDDYCIHEIRDDLREEQRKALRKEQE